MKRQIQYFPRLQKGLTLIELMIAMGVALGLGAIVVAVAAGVRSESKNSHLYKQITHIANAAQDAPLQGLGAGAMDYLISAGKIPEKWVQTIRPGSYVVQHPYGSAIYLYEGQVTGVADTPLELEVQDISASVCTDISMRAKSDFIRIRAPGGSISPDSTASTVGEACEGGGNLTLNF